MPSLLKLLQQNMLDEELNKKSKKNLLHGGDFNEEKKKN